MEDYKKVISAKEFYKDYYSYLPIYGITQSDKFSISITIMTQEKYLFSCNFFGRYHSYEFNMEIPEVYAINTFGEEYIPLSKEDIELIQEKLNSDDTWNKIINTYRDFIGYQYEQEGLNCYTEEGLSKIPSIPPDYNLIWENGYTGKEDEDFVSYDYM